MSRADLDRAQEFVWRNARLLDRHRMKVLLTGSEEARNLALTALRAYQNPDGGFGNALEPDLRTPLSQPQPAEYALRTLDEIGRFDADVVGRLCEWLETVTTAAGGIPFVLPSAKQHPHAPWWTTGDDPPADLNPTAAIVGLLHKHGIRHRWLAAATDFCWRAIESGAEPDERHAFISTFTFLEHVPDRHRAKAAIERLGQRLVEEGHVTLDPSAEGYVHTPLDFAPTPSAIAAPLFDPEAIETSLEALSQAQRSDGGWSITWEAPTPAAEVEWRGAVTVNALGTLRAWGRL